MRPLFLSLLLCISSISTYSQVPQAFNYQAVARGSNGEPLVNQSIGVNINILSGSANGTISYSENHAVVTNDFGLFSLMVGSGTAVSNSWSNINWSEGSKYLEIAIDILGGTNYETVGTVQLLSVPYALYAANSGGDADSDPTNEIQQIKIEGTEISISDGNTIDVGSVNTDAQTLSLVGNDLSISGGNTIAFPVGSVDADADPDNEIQDLQLDGNNLMITNNASATTVDLSPYLDDTKLTEAEVETFITNNSIDLFSGSSVNGNAINDWNSLDNVPSDISDGDDVGIISESDPVFDASEAANITSADITNLGNLSGVNSGDQTLSFANGEISITGANTIDITEVVTLGDYYYYDGDADNTGDPKYPVWVPDGVSAPSSYVIQGGDCDDNDDSIYPGGEVCDGIDNDCDGGVDEGYSLDCSSCLLQFYPPPGFPGACSTFCSASTTCNGRGICTIQGNCLCYSDPLNGYFAGPKCDQCAEGWTGVNCNIPVD